MSENKEIEIGYNLMLALIVMAVCGTACIALIFLKSINVTLSPENSLEATKGMTTSKVAGISIIHDSLLCVDGKIVDTVNVSGGYVDPPHYPIRITWARKSDSLRFYSKRTTEPSYHK